jgi:hypothetical protein
MARTKRKKLKPAGHSAVIEAMIQPAIVIGSTLMSAIAAYVLGADELARIFDGRGRGIDWFIVCLCGGMGFLIDMAIIVSATRYKMHTVRKNPDENKWKRLAQYVLTLGLASESMTLLYFFVHLGASAFPGLLVQLADAIHAVLAVSRAFLPPVVIAYFVAGILPVVVERQDRNREIQVRTSQNIMVLIDRLSAVEDTDDKQEMLKALGGQLVLDTYATYDRTGLTTEADQRTRDTTLLMHLARLNGLDWNLIRMDDNLPEQTPVTSPAVAAKPQLVPITSREDQDEDERDEPGRVRFDDERQAVVDGWLGLNE